MVALDPEPFSYGLALEGFRHTIDKLELEFARYAAEFEASKEWAAEGYNSDRRLDALPLPHDLDRCLAGDCRRAARRLVAGKPAGFG